MSWGKRNRLSNIIKPDTGRTVMLAVDHGYFLVFPGTHDGAGGAGQNHCSACLLCRFIDAHQRRPAHISRPRNINPYRIASLRRHQHPQ